MSKSSSSLKVGGGRGGWQLLVLCLLRVQLIKARKLFVLCLDLVRPDEVKHWQHRCWLLYLPISYFTIPLSVFGIQYSDSVYCYPPTSLICFTRINSNVDVERWTTPATVRLPLADSLLSVLLLARSFSVSLSLFTLLLLSGSSICISVLA